MAVGFTADEILEMAEQIETRGARFYRQAVKLHLKARDLLQQIAVQEDMHFKAFSNMRKQLTPNEQRDYDPSGDVALYLEAYVKGQAFYINKEPADLLTGRESLVDLFNMAIGLEKDSIVFYLGLKDLVPSSAGKSRIDGIIKEEMKHITWLSERKIQRT